MPIKKKTTKKRKPVRGFSKDLRGLSKKQKLAAEKKFLAKLEAKFGKRKVFSDFFKHLKKRKPKKKTTKRK